MKVKKSVATPKSRKSGEAEGPTKKAHPETPEERARSERAYIAWLNEQAKVREWNPADADVLPEEDKEGDNE